MYQVFHLTIIEHRILRTEMPLHYLQKLLSLDKPLSIAAWQRDCFLKVGLRPESPRKTILGLTNCNRLQKKTQASFQSPSRELMQSLNSLTISNFGLSGFISWWWKQDWKGKNTIFLYWARTLNAIFLSEHGYAIQHNSKLHCELQCQVLLQSRRLPNKIQWKSQHSFVNGCTWYVQD